MDDIDINTLTMEHYLVLTRRNQAPGVVKPEIKGNVSFEIKSQFMREHTFSRNKNDDAYEYVERSLDIVSLFNILGVTHDLFMPRIFPITLTGVVKGWVDRLSLRTINTWDLLKNTFIKRYCPSSKMATQLKEIHNFKQEAITNKLDSLGRNMKKLKENVNVIQCKEIFANNEAPTDEACSKGATELQGVSLISYENVQVPKETEERPQGILPC
ncbi:hypothetical protein Tco_0086100 [Tanacetum coccineum]